MRGPTPGKVSRRQFIVSAGAGVAAASLGLYYLRARDLGPGPVVGPDLIPHTAIEATRYGDFRDLWRERWTWDRVVHTSHARANCISACSWNALSRRQETTHE